MSQYVSIEAQTLGPRDPLNHIQNSISFVKALFVCNLDDSNEHTSFYIRESIFTDDT